MLRSVHTVLTDRQIRWNSMTLMESWKHYLSIFNSTGLLHLVYTCTCSRTYISYTCKSFHGVSNFIFSQFENVRTVLLLCNDLLCGDHVELFEAALP